MDGDTLTPDKGLKTWSAAWLGGRRTREDIPKVPALGVKGKAAERKTGKAELRSGEWPERWEDGLAAPARPQEAPLSGQRVAQPDPASGVTRAEPSAQRA